MAAATYQRDAGRIRVKVWVRQIPVGEQVYWCICMVTGITICLSIAIALWKFGFLGGVVVGLTLRNLLST
ncbi:MAG TPA: hypothetical protein V6D10_20615 [Trichocoleus sp.]